MSSYNIRNARQDDLPRIVQLLADDPLGIKRESYQNPLPQAYYAAFKEIDEDKNNFLIVIEDGNNILGTLQLTIMTHLTYQGGKRAEIEGVRVAESCRRQGIGQLLLKWAIQKAHESGCHLVQLTTNKQRPQAAAFYKKLGFINSHEGMKLHLGKSE